MAALTSWASEASAVKHTESFAIEDTIRHSLNFISDRSCTGPPFSDARVMSYAGYPAFQLAISNTVETASFTVEIRETGRSQSCAFVSRLSPYQILRNVLKCRVSDQFVFDHQPTIAIRRRCNGTLR